MRHFLAYCAFGLGTYIGFVIQNRGDEFINWKLFGRESFRLFLFIFAWPLYYYLLIKDTIKCRKNIASNLRKNKLN